MPPQDSSHNFSTPLPEHYGRKRPVSKRKIQANRRNALRSTGPRTARGKQIVGRNAIKHGLLAREVVITAGYGKENLKEFHRLVERLWEGMRVRTQGIAGGRGRAQLWLASRGGSDKLLRYESHLDRQLYRTMDQLERLQRQRRGENVPPPLNINFGKRTYLRNKAKKLFVFNSRVGRSVEQSQSTYRDQQNGSRDGTSC